MAKPVKCGSVKPGNIVVAVLSGIRSKDDPPDMTYSEVVIGTMTFNRKTGTRKQGKMRMIAPVIFGDGTFCSGTYIDENQEVFSFRKSAAAKETFDRLNRIFTEEYCGRERCKSA